MPSASSAAGAARTAGKKKKKKGGKKGRRMTEDSPMTMAIAAMKEHKDFGNMVKYNLSALLLSVAPGHAGWEDNCAEFVRQGGIGVLKEIIEIHAKKGNEEILNMATKVLEACTRISETRKEVTAKVIKKKGVTKLLKAAQRVPKLTATVGAIMTVCEHCADVNAKLMSNEAHVKPLIANLAVFKNDPPTLAATHRVLEKILRSGDALKMAAKLGIVEAIVEGFRADHLDPDTVLPALVTLDRLMNDESNIARYNACDGTFEALLGVIDAMAHRNDVLVVAGSVMNKIAGKYLLKYLEQLMSGTLSNDERDRILRIVASLALEPKNAAIINRTDGAISCILGFMKPAAAVKDSVMPCIAAIVERCATTDAAAQGLIALGAIDAIVAAMKANPANSPFQTAACRALAKLATSGAHIDALVGKGGVKEVCTALKRDAAHPDVPLAAVNFINTVGNVTKMDDVQLEGLIKEMVGAGAVNGILAALDAPALEADGVANSDSPEFAAAAMKALALLSRESPKALKEMLAGSAVDWAIHNLTDEKLKMNEAVVEASLKFLAALVEDPSDQSARADVVKKVVKAGAVDPSVMALFNHPDHKGIQEAGQNVIRLIVGPEAVASMVDTLRKNLAKLKLIEDPTATDVRMVEIPAMALAAFASYNADAIIQGGGVKALVELLKWATVQRNMPRQEEVLAACMVALKALAVEDDEESSANLFEWLAEEDGVSAVAAAVKKHPKLVSSAKTGIQLMGVLALSPNSHNELINNDGIEAAVGGLKRNNGDVGMNNATVQMYGRLALDPLGAAEVAGRGGVKALVDVLRKKAANDEFIQPAVSTFNLIVDAAQNSSPALATMRDQNILSGVITTMQDQPDKQVYEAGTRAIDALLNDEAVRIAVKELKKAAKGAEDGTMKKLDKLTSAQRVVGYISTADRFADRIVQLKGPAALVKALVSVYDMPESKTGRIECLTAGVEACGLLAGKVAASEYRGAVPVVLNLLPELRSPACLVCIDRFAHDDSNIGKVVSMGTIPEILAMIKESGDDPLIARPAFGALATLAKHQAACDAINAAYGADVTRDWLTYNLGDEKQEAAAVSALELLAALGADEKAGAALCADLRDTGALDNILAAIFESSRKPPPNLIAAALALAAVCTPDQENLMSTFVDTGRLRKLVDMYDTFGRDGDLAAPLHGTNAECKNLARNVITLHNNLRRADLHDEVEAEGIARLIDEIVALHPSLAGLIDGKQPNRMLADALRNLDARVQDSDDGGAANLDGLYKDVLEVNNCMAMEDALDETNGPWALASFSDALGKLKDVQKAFKKKDPEASLIIDGLNSLMVWDSDTATGLPFAGMVQELNGYFENGGDTSKKAMKLVGDLSSNFDVVHELANAGTVKEIADRFESLKTAAAASASASAGRRGTRRGSASLGTEGNVAQLNMMRVYTNLAPHVAGVMGTTDQVTPVTLYNASPESLILPALRKLAETEDGMGVIVSFAEGNVDGVNRNVELAALALLGELIAARGHGEEIDEMSPDLFMKMMGLAPKMMNNLSTADFDAFMKSLERQFLRPGFADELLAANPDFLKDLHAMLASGEREKVIVGSRIFKAFNNSLPINNTDHLLGKLEESQLNQLVANTVAPAHEAYGEGTLQNNLDALNAVVSVMEDKDCDAWNAMGLDETAYESLSPIVNAFARAEDDDGKAVFEAGIELLEALQEKHDITPEYDLDKTLGDNFAAVKAANCYDLYKNDADQLVFMMGGKESLTPPKEYHALMAALENMATCAEMSVGACGLVAEEQMKALCECLLKHACDATAALALAKLLNRLAENDKNLSNIAKFGGLEGIIQALIKNPENTPLLRVLIHLLEKFVKHDVFKEQIGSLDGCKALIMCLTTHCTPEFVAGKGGPAGGAADPAAPALESVRGDLNDHDVMMVAMLSLIANLAYNSHSNVERILAANGVEAMHLTLGAYDAHVKILEVAMCNFSNWMFADEDSKEVIGDRCTGDIINVIVRHSDEPALFKMTMRAIGNLSTVDENVRHIIHGGAITAIVEAMQSEQCSEDKGCQTIAIQVIGNMAAASEEVDLGSHDEDETVSAVIFRQGGAHAVLDAARSDMDDNGTLLCALEALNHVCSDARTAAKLNDAGLIDLTLDAMRGWEDDVEIIERCFDLFYTLCFAPECAEVFVSMDGLPLVFELFEALASESPDGILVMGQAALHVLLKDKPKADLRRYAEEVMEAGGTEVTAKLVEENLENGEFVTEALETIGRIAVHEDLAHGVSMQFMPALRKIIMYCLHETDEASHQELDRAFKIMGLFAFDSKNIESIVANGGLPLLLHAVAKYPREEKLMIRAIKTIDFIGMGDHEYTKIVIAKGGKKVVEKIMEVYPRSSEIQSLGKGALVHLASLEEADGVAGADAAEAAEMRL